MKIYTHASLNQGTGIFDHVMRDKRMYPGYNDAMPTQVAVGFIAAAIKAGLSYREIDNVLNASFDEKTAKLLRSVREAYDGEDPRFSLWEWQSDDMYRLHNLIACTVSPRWQINRLEMAASH